MTIVTLGSRFFIPVENGFKEISREVALDMYEKGEVTQEIPLEMELD
jgi:hypothetical protein